MVDLDLDTLVAVEREGWDALCTSTGSEFYGGMMTRDALMILVNGVTLDRDAVVSSLNEAPPWDRYQLAEQQVVPLGLNVTALIYRATAYRGDEQPFEALMASTYVLVDDELRLALYQQTTTTH